MTLTNCNNIIIVVMHVQFPITILGLSLTVYVYAVAFVKALEKGEVFFLS